MQKEATDPRGSSKGYNGSTKDIQSRCILLTGSVDERSIERILNTFSEKNRPHFKVLSSDSVVIHRVTKAFSSIKHIDFYEGSPMCRSDVSKLKLGKLCCCFVLADRFASEEEEEDQKNILRLWGLKSFKPELIVYIQILKESSRSHLLAFPPTYITNDHIICFEEMKMSIMAQSCMYPGIITLVSNLIRKPNQI